MGFADSSVALFIEILLAHELRRYEERLLLAAISLKPRGDAGFSPRRSLTCNWFYSLMKCFSNRRFDRSAPSSVSITDFAFVAGS